jgi:hypothetical protein
VRPAIVAIAVLIAGPLALYTQSGERLAMCDGDLVVTRYSLWGLRERPVGRLDGGAGHWWIVTPDGTEPYAWEHAPAIVAPKVPPVR